MTPQELAELLTERIIGLNLNDLQKDLNDPQGRVFDPLWNFPTQEKMLSLASEIIEEIEDDVGWTDELG